MKRRSRRKKVRIVIEARDPNDARQILDALAAAADGVSRESLSEGNKAALSGERPPTAAPSSSVPDEQLETRLADGVAKHLDAKADSIDKGGITSADAVTTQGAADRAKEIVTRRHRLRCWLVAAGALGYRCTIKVAADLIKELGKPH